MLKLIKMHLKNEKGLTLVELLVVIVILGIIASIAVVSIGNIIDDTKNKAKVTEAVQIINAAKLKHAADGKYPNSGWYVTADTNDKNRLDEYVSNLKDTSWVVKWTKAGGYTIDDHEGSGVVNDVADTTPVTNTAEISEDELTDYLDGE